jgi:serine/threonine protein kinase
MDVDERITAAPGRAAPPRPAPPPRPPTPRASFRERSDLRGAAIGAGRFRLGAPLGTGGTAIVFSAIRVSDRQAVVVKVLREAYAQHPELIRRLRREAEVGRSVSHPGIVQVLDEGFLPDGSPFLVLERLYGECLARLLQRRGPLPAEEVATIALRSAAVLHAAHGHGFVHRDVKPEHIVLDRTVDGHLDVRVLDFGVCADRHAPEDELELERGRVYGTPTYVSPEQAAGCPGVDARADVFGLGIVMFEALSGRLPYRAPKVGQILRKIIREDAPRIGLILPELRRDVDEVVAQAMARVPERRFASARALSRALLPLCGDRRAVERRLAADVRRRGPGRRKPKVDAAA